MQSGNNEEYIDLVFERIDNASVLSNFYCGIPDMDDFIHAKLQGYLNRTGCEAYVIKQKNEIVAFDSRYFLNKSSAVICLLTFLAYILLYNPKGVT